MYFANLTGQAFQVAILEQAPRLSLSLTITNDSGRPIETIEVGQTFWLEFHGDDLRNAGTGIFSAFLNLQTGDHVTFDGTAEAGLGLSLIDADRVGDKINEHSISDLGVVRSGTEAPGGDSQSLLRVRATANRVGPVEFISIPSRNPTAETVLFGDEAALSEDLIQRISARLRIVEHLESFDRGDVNRDGKVQAIDALKVINLVTRYGIGAVSDITSRIDALSPRANGSPVAINVNHFDVNRSGTITPLDALLVINRISALRRQGAPDGIAAPEPRSVREDFQTAVATMFTDPSIDDKD